MTLPARRRTLSRRLFLSGAAGTALSLPILPSLLRRSARADGAALPRRLVVVLTSNGVRGAHFWPGASTDSLLSERAPGVRDVPLESLAGPMSDVFGSAFDPLRPKMTLVRGLDALGFERGHFAQHTLSGWPDHEGEEERPVSIDQVLARSACVYETEPALRSLHLLVKPRHDDVGPRVSVTHAGTGVDPITSPAHAFSRLFTGFSPPMVSAEPDPRNARRLRVLDHVHDQVSRLRDHHRIGAEDRARLQEHVAMLDDLSRRVAATTVAPSGCVVPELASWDDEPDGEAHLPEWTAAQVDLVAAAVRCDLTRVVVLQLCAPTDVRTFSFLPETLGDHHDLSHTFDATSFERLRTANQWYAGFVARLLSALDVVEDPSSGATYLDNSLVYWGNEAGTATGEESHLQWGFPVMLAGSAGGILSPGRYVDYRRPGTRVQWRAGGELRDQSFGDDAGRPYNELLVTIARTFGLRPEEYELHRGPGFGDYFNPQGYDLGDQRSPLPYL